MAHLYTESNGSDSVDKLILWCKCGALKGTDEANLPCTLSGK